MWTTADDIYGSFLDGIRRTSQTVVKKAKFSRIWNDWALNRWVKENLSIKEGLDLTDKQRMDLDPLIVLTDGKYRYEDSTVLSAITPASWTTNVFIMPDGVTAISNESGVDIIYPNCKRITKVWFKIDSSSTYVKGTPFKAIDEDFITKSKYSAPSTELPYYRVRNGKIELITASGSLGTAMKLEYIMYPNVMTYVSATNSLSYTLNFGQDQLEEIRDIAVRLYLERIKDPRWQSFLQEDMLKNIIQQ